MKKMHLIVPALLISCLALVLSVFALFFSLDNRASLSSKNEVPTSVSDQGSVVEGHMQKEEGKLTVLENAELESDVTSVLEEGSWHVKVLQVAIDEGVLDIELEMTNNTPEASFYYGNIEIDAYQQGLELEKDVLGESDKDNPNGKLQPGSSTTKHICYKLASMTDDVLVELSFLSEDVVASASWQIS